MAATTSATTAAHTSLRYQCDQFPTTPDRGGQHPVAPLFRIFLPQPSDQGVPLSPLPGRELVRFESLPMQFPCPSGAGVRHSPAA